MTDSATRSQRPASGPRRRCVLVADDSETIQAMAEEILGRSGYEVLVASDGVSALRLAGERPPDAVLLDLLMPRLTGFDVLREIRKDPRLQDVRVIVMSGVYQDNVAGFLEELGADAFVAKEALRGELVDRVRDVLADSDEDGAR